MKNDEADPPYKTIEIGTPLDYTEDVYKIYLEVREHDGMVRRILTEFLGEAKAKHIVALTHGYELDLPIQAVPDLVSLLCQQNIAVYQVVRYAKTNSRWR